MTHRAPIPATYRGPLLTALGLALALAGLYLLAGLGVALLAAGVALAALGLWADLG